MYELVRISLHNWYLVDAQDIPVHNHAAVIGPTGAGKSSVLDCIQTVISGNNQNALELNAAAGQHQGRSVRDYCLGTVSDVNDGAPRRKRCESTLALSFIDKKTKRKAVIGVFLYAEADKKEQTRRFMIEDAEFRIEEHVKNGAVVTHNDMIDAIRKKDGDKNLKFFPNSTKFVGAFLEYMRPGMPPDPKRFLRSFSNALQAKEMSDPTDFVRRFVLEAMPLDVDAVRSSMSIWKELTEEVARLEMMVAELTNIDRNFQKGFQAKVQMTDLLTLESQLKMSAAQFEIDGLKKETKNIVADAYKLHETIEDIKGELSELEAEEDALKKRIASDDVGAQMALLDAQAGTAHEKRTSLSKDVEGALAKIRELKYLEGLKSGIPEAGAIADVAKEVATMTLDKMPEELALRSAEISDKVTSLRGLEDVITKLQEFGGRVTEQRVVMRRKLEEFGDVGAGGAVSSPFSRNVTRFLSALEMAGIRAQCLPDLVDMDDPGWAFAIESLLGPNREAILVDEADQKEAFNILFRNRNEYDSVRLIDVRNLRRQNPRVAQNPIVDAISTNNSDIERFLDYSIGRYSKAETEEDLDRYPNAIMRNGKTSSGVTKRVFRDRTTILGKRAQQRAMEESKEERNRLATEMADLEKKSQQIAALTGRCQRALDVDIDTLSDNLNALSEAVNTIRGFKQQKETMEAPDLKDANDKLAEVQEQIARLKPQLAGLETQKGQFEVKRAVFEEKIKELTEKLPEIEEILEEARSASESPSIARIREQIHLDWPVLPVSQEDIDKLDDMEPAEASLSTSQLSTILKEYLDAFRKRGDAEQYIKRGNNGLLQYGQKWMLDTIPMKDEDSDEDRFFWTISQLEKSRDHELLKYRERLEQARDDMETSLKEGLISKLGEQFALMEQQLSNLNRRLAKHTFVGQTYQYRSSVSARFEPIYELVMSQKDMEITEETEADDGRFDALEELFNSEEKDAKLFEDYRNYFNFELFIEHPDPDNPEIIVATPFSKVIGKLSGGQRQAPHYVAIAASMVNAYYPKAQEGDTDGMGLCLFDEAFNKLDIKNTQRLMDLYRSLGLQVIVAAPEEKRPSLIECVDSIISVNRANGSDEVFIDMAAIGPKAKKAMLDENPVHQPVPA